MRAKCCVKEAYLAGRAGVGTEGDRFVDVSLDLGKFATDGYQENHVVCEGSRREHASCPSPFVLLSRAREL